MFRVVELDFCFVSYLGKVEPEIFKKLSQQDLGVAICLSFFLSVNNLTGGFCRRSMCNVNAKC